MDIERLIETLRQHGVSCVRTCGKYCSICDEAATALSTLQAKNEKLLAELYSLRPGFQNQKALIKQLRTELEQVKQDRLGWLSPICIGCPGKTEDGKRTELCGELDDLERCVEQSKRLAELARAALRREQDG